MWAVSLDGQYLVGVRVRGEAGVAKRKQMSEQQEGLLVLV
jgi:hypothetical protein